LPASCRLCLGRDSGYNEAGKMPALHYWRKILKSFFLFVFILISSPIFAFQSVVFLPFGNDSESQQIYLLGEGFSESLSEEMLLKDVYVIQRPERMAAYDSLRLPYVGHLSRATMLKIGENLAADYVVFGSYKLEQKNLKVEARVIRTSSSKLSNPIQSAGTLDHLYDVQRALKAGLKQYFTNEKLLPSENKIELNSVPLHAYELYIKGLLENSDKEKVSFFERAIQEYPIYSLASYRLGLSLFRVGRFKEANEALAKVTGDGSLRVRIDFLMGVNSFFLGDYAAAVEKWFALSKTNPSAEVYNNIGISLIRKNEIEDAVWYLNKAVELDPQNGDFRYNLAACYSQKEAPDDAVQHFREAIQFHPNDYQALYWLGRTLEKQGKPESKQVLAFYLERLPGDQRGKFPDQFPTATAALRAAYAYLSKEEKDYMNVARSKASKQREDYTKTYQGSADKQLKDAHPDLAVQEIKKGLTLSPFDSYLNYLWGLSYVKQGNNPAAIPYLQFSLWCTDNVDSHLLLAELYSEGQQLENAKKQIQQVLALDPKNKKALDIWGKLTTKK
jgi:tetratricopeptide (TPR) repeat protein